MKNLKNNLYYFNLSKENPEDLFDDNYTFTDKHPDLDKYVQATKDIKSLLITIKTLEDEHEKKEVIEKYYIALSEKMLNYSNCSEFACFISACDNTVSEVVKEYRLLKEIVYKYFKCRDIKDNVPSEWVQALLDSNSSRKKGKCGENKLIKILNRFGFVETKDWDSFFNNTYSVMKFSKKINLLSARENLKIKIKTKKQNKTMDLIIKANDKIFLCEAKHLNVAGGEQDKQISELIEIIGLYDKKVSYISFCDGNYSNILLSDDVHGKKLDQQRKEISENLSKNPNNYWVNTFGFKQLFKDFSAQK